MCCSGGGIYKTAAAGYLQEGVHRGDGDVVELVQDAVLVAALLLLRCEG
jgi:hypothetical protein